MTAGALASRGADPSLGAGRLFAGSDESPELCSSLALRLPVSCPDVHWGVPGTPPGAVLRLPAGTADFFFLLERAILNSLRMAGESCKIEIALKKASFSCLSIMLRQELLLTTKNTTLPTGWCSRPGLNQPPISLSLPSQSTKQPVPSLVAEPHSTTAEHRRVKLVVHLKVSNTLHVSPVRTAQ